MGKQRSRLPGRLGSFGTDARGARPHLFEPQPTMVGCVTAIRRFLAAGTGGAIVNVSSHQAQRAVRGAVTYATAKAAIEGLTRALAVDYGPQGIRINAVALGSIATERYEEFLARQEPAAVARIEEEMRLLHPLGRVGRPEEVAAAVAYLRSRTGRASLMERPFPSTAGGARTRSRRSMSYRPHLAESVAATAG
jgi:NAD(P)-dependent dehydrogenase (short-subunit alcohol dehydrogenase family)